MATTLTDRLQACYSGVVNDVMRSMEVMAR